jgi:putative FmdB family regulatory protein
MPLYYLKCKMCGREFEVICPIEDRNYQACECGSPVRVIPAVHGPNCSNDSASWLPSVLEVVAKDDPSPHVVNFLKNPTRTNYKAWMKGEGLRPLEPGEKSRKEEIDVRRHTEHLMRRKQERGRIHVR